MIGQFLTHPATAFTGGIILTIGGLAALLTSCAPPNRTATDVQDYRDELAKAPTAAADDGATKRFGNFLSGIGDENYVRENTSKVFARDAYLNDTLVTHRGAAEIEKYFLKTSRAMESYNVTIDEVVKSGPNHYFRWTMVFQAKALGQGKPIHSVGISQVRFDESGKVAFQQDFWDSGKNLFGQAPVAGAVIGFIRKQLEKP